MAEFQDPFQVTITPPLCDITPCPPCLNTPSIEDCFVCGYPSGAFTSCQSTATPCLDGAVSCLDCESVFDNLDIKFLGGFVSGFSSRLGFGASESTLNVDLVLPKYRCPSATNSGPVGVCCEPDQTCTAGYNGQEDCENAGGTWFGDKTCDDNPCSCPECGTDPKYEGKLGYIYTFNMGAFCFKGILSNHTYTEDSSGYKYKVTLTDGRTVLSNTAILLNGTYTKLPKEFSNNAISVGASEDSVSENTCGNGRQCKDFMITGSNSARGVKLKAALEAINDHCISIPVSNAGLKINVTKLINVVSDELRTTNTESTALELITLAAEESGYDFIVSINNNNEFEILPVNQKRPATEKSLFSFIEELSARDIVISKEYGEEMAGSSAKSKRIVFGNNLSYITSIRDYPLQRYVKPEQELDLNLSNICCKPSFCCYDTSLPGYEDICIDSNLFDTQEECENGGYTWKANGFDCISGDDLLTLKGPCEAAGGTWYSNSSCAQEACYMQPPCSIKNNPASIGAYDAIYITPTPYPDPEEC